MQIRKAVIPAAGLGTRFLPVTMSVPKELLPIIDRPLLQYVIAEAAEAGVEEVIIVTSPGKESISGYFRPQPALEQRLAASGETGCDTANFSTFDGTDSSYEVIYPVHGQSGVATKWLGYESPQPPLPEGESYHLTSLIDNAKKRGMKVGVYPIGENTWTDVGQWGEYQKAVDHFQT